MCIVRASNTYFESKTKSLTNMAQSSYKLLQDLQNSTNYECLTAGDGKYNTNVYIELLKTDHLGSLAIYLLRYN